MPMLLLYVILALVTMGFVVPCVLDIATTPQRYFDLPSKRTWLVVTVAFWAFGAAAWLIAGRLEVRERRRWNDEVDRWLVSRVYPSGRRPSGVGKGTRFPFGRARRARQAPPTAPARFLAPDDNPEFLLELDHRIE